MLDTNDLKAIAELMDSRITASEERMKEHMEQRIAASEKMMESRIAASEELTERRIAASEERLKVFIIKQAQNATHNALVVVENDIKSRLDAIKEGMDLALELPRVSEERVERIEQEIVAIKMVVGRHSEEIELLKRGA